MNKKFFLIVLIFIVLAMFMVFSATRDTTALVLLPSDIVKKGESANLTRIRVGGRVTKDAVAYQLEPSIRLEFRIEDPKDPSGSIPVVYRGIKPDMFEAGRDVIIDGDFESGTLIASKLLTQCPSKYEPPAPQRQGS